MGLVVTDLEAIARIASIGPFQQGRPREQERGYRSPTLRIW